MYTVLELDEVEPGTKTVILMNYIVSFQEKLPWQHTAKDL